MTDTYNELFYASFADGSESSASVIVPLVLSTFPAASVVDIGCGVGAWLRAFERHGISDYLGLDGDYVPREALRIPADRFRAVELRTLSDVRRRFDIACSLEVAEHLPPSCAEQFVQVLTKAAPVVLFSAAIPHQGGAGHVNEQWQSYWCELFFRNGFVAIDMIRPKIYGDPRVEWWYRQNVLVYCDRDHRPAGHASILDPFLLNRVDPAMIEALAVPPLYIRAAVSAVSRDLAALGSAVSRRIHRNFRR